MFVQSLEISYYFSSCFSPAVRSSDEKAISVISNSNHPFFVASSSADGYGTISYEDSMTLLRAYSFISNTLLFYCLYRLKYGGKIFKLRWTVLAWWNKRWISWLLPGVLTFGIAARYPSCTSTSQLTRVTNKLWMCLRDTLIRHQPVVNINFITRVSFEISLLIGI